jgi:hypothetical protein
MKARKSLSNNRQHLHSPIKGVLGHSFFFWFSRVSECHFGVHPVTLLKPTQQRVGRGLVGPDRTIAPTGFSIFLSAARKLKNTKNMNLSSPPSTPQRIRAVTSHALEYKQRWHASPPSTSSLHLKKYHADLLCALVLIAGHGPARVPTCEHTRRHVQQEYALLRSNDQPYSKGPSPSFKFPVLSHALAC